MLIQILNTFSKGNGDNKQRQKEMNMAHNNNKYIVSVVKVGLNTIGIRNEKGKERKVSLFVEM
jgi:hypothetical protein